MDTGGRCGEATGLVMQETKRDWYPPIQWAAGVGRSRAPQTRVGRGLGRRPSASPAADRWELRRVRPRDRNRRRRRDRAAPAAPPTGVGRTRHTTEAARSWTMPLLPPAARLTGDWETTPTGRAAWDGAARTAASTGRRPSAVLGVAVVQPGVSREAARPCPRTLRRVQGLVVGGTALAGGVRVVGP